jgi:hypothetical protein
MCVVVHDEYSRCRFKPKNWTKRRDYLSYFEADMKSIIKEFVKPFVVNGITKNQIIGNNLKKSYAYVL